MKRENIDWLAALNPKVAAQTKDSARRQKKLAVISKIAGDIENLRTKMIANGKLKVTDTQGNEQNIIDFEKRDQKREFDMDDMRERFALGQVIRDGMTTFAKNQALEDTAAMEMHLETKRLVDAMIQQLEGEKEESDELDEHGVKKKVPLFGKEDLMDEIYQPLVRQGLMGETFVPNEFSKTKKMLDKTFEDYGKRLQSEDEKGFFSTNKELLLTSATSLVAIGGSVATGFTVPVHQDASWAPQAFNTGLTSGPQIEAATIMGYVGWGMQVLTQAPDFYEEVGKPGVINPIKKKLSEADMRGRVAVAPTMAQGIVCGLAAHLGGALSGAGLGVAGGSAFGSVVKVAAIAKELGGDGIAKGNVIAVRDLVAGAYTKVMIDIAPGDNAVTDDKIKEAGAAMATEYKAKVPVDTILAALQETDSQTFDAAKVISLFVSAGQAAVAKGQPILGPLLANAELKKKILQKVNDKLSADFLKEQEDFDRKAQGEVDDLTVLGDIKTEASKLDKKIKELEREQAILKWGASTLGLGFSIASQVLAPLAIGGALVGMAQNLIEAGKRTRDIVKFIDSREGMLNAASGYYSAVENFVQNSQLQAFHYYINAAFQTAQMIGAILQCTGILFAAGAAVTAASGGAAALEAFLYAAKKRMDLATAWRQYKLALSRPENRKLGLIAVKANPTLAKYAVAWGAVIEGDPLVSDFLSRCGLNETNIDDDATTDDVVRYLEVRMPDDNVVVGKKFPSVEFAPSPLVLTCECWASAKSRGQTKAQLKPQDTRSLDAALTRFAALAATMPATIGALDQQITDATPAAAATPVPREKIVESNKQITACEELVLGCQTHLATAKKAWEGYTPTLIDDAGANIGPHTKMKLVVDDFLGLVAESEAALDLQATHVKGQKDLVAAWVSA